MYDKDSEFFNELLGTYFDEYMHFSYSKAFSSKTKYGPRILVIVIKVVGTIDKKKEELVDTLPKELVDIRPTPPLEGDGGDVKEGKRLKIVISNKLLNKFPLLLAQLKAGNYSYKLKNEIRQALDLLHQHNKITENLYYNLM